MVRRGQRLLLLSNRDVLVLLVAFQALRVGQRRPLVARKVKALPCEASTSAPAQPTGERPDGLGKAVGLRLQNYSASCFPWRPLLSLTAELLRRGPLVRLLPPGIRLD